MKKPEEKIKKADAEDNEMPTEEQIREWNKFTKIRKDLAEIKNPDGTCRICGGTCDNTIKTIGECAACGCPHWITRSHWSGVIIRDYDSDGLIMDAPANGKPMMHQEHITITFCLHCGNIINHKIKTTEADWKPTDDADGHPIDYLSENLQIDANTDFSDLRNYKNYFKKSLAEIIQYADGGTNFSKDESLRAIISHAVELDEFIDMIDALTWKVTEDDAEWAANPKIWSKKDDSGDSTPASSTIDETSDIPNSAITAAVGKYLNDELQREASFQVMSHFLESKNAENTPQRRICYNCNYYVPSPNFVGEGGCHKHMKGEVKAYTKGCNDFEKDDRR